MGTVQMSTNSWMDLKNHSACIHWYFHMFSVLKRNRLVIPSEKAMATHSSTLAWKIPWTEEPGRLPSVGSHRVGHDWVTSLSLFTFMHWRRNGNPLQCSCLENPMDRGAWWAAVYGISQSWTQLKQLSSSSSSSDTINSMNESEKYTRPRVPRHIRIHTMWFHLCEILEQAKYLLW